MYESTTRERATRGAGSARFDTQAAERCPQCRSLTQDRYAFCPACGTPLRAHRKVHGHGPSRQVLSEILPPGGIEAVLRDPRYRPALYMAAGIFLAIVFVQVAHAVAAIITLALLIMAVVYGTRAYLRRAR